MNADRLKEVESVDLKHGSHKSFQEGGCIMEMVAYIADEPWSDHPECACPILTAYAIALNDRFKTTDRQKMKPFIPLLLDTKSTDAVQISRKRLIMWRNVTATYPLILDLIKRPELAVQLRALPNTNEGMAQAKVILSENRESIRANANANAYANANANAYAYANANAYADAYAYANAYAYAYAYANANAYADADANANANAYAYANAYADADAYANANAYANAYAYTLRAKIVETALETLHLAIEIKP